MNDKTDDDQATPVVTNVEKAYTPECPTELGPEARRVWDRLLPALMQEDHFRPGDEIGLSMICFGYGVARGRRSPAEVRGRDENKERQPNALSICVGRQSKRVARHLAAQRVWVYSSQSWATSG